MNSDRQPTLDEVFPLPKGIKFRQPKFGSKPASSVTAVRRSDTDVGPTPEAFEIRWEDADQGLAVRVREQPDGRLIAETSCSNVAVLGKWVSVALVGTTTTEMIRKTIPFSVVETNGCRGSADFGPLADAVRDLGRELRIIVFLLLDPAVHQS